MAEMGMKIENWAVYIRRELPKKEVQELKKSQEGIEGRYWFS